LKTQRNQNEIIFYAIAKLESFSNFIFYENLEQILEYFKKPGRKSSRGQECQVSSGWLGLIRLNKADFTVCAYIF